MAAETTIDDGLVKAQQYDQLVQSDFFKEVEAFSDDFISKVGPLIHSYNFRWVSDPFHQWSRQWEYLYIINQAQTVSKDAAIVDLGAGVSFLPYYLKQKLGLPNIVAIDNDKSLEGLYKKVNDKIGDSIAFQYGDMRNLSNIADESVDFAYSVSVLEHTDAYPAVLQEIHRILKPGGKLSLTFDISLDGLDDIPLGRAHQLIASLEKVFGSNLSLDLDQEIANPDLVISKNMAKRDKKLMPWKYPFLNVVKHVINYGKPGSIYKNLTFCCVTVAKKVK